MADAQLSKEQIQRPHRSSIHAVIRSQYADMPPAERRLAEVVLNFPGDIAGYSATELATLAEVSNAAVSRFVRRLGYTNYDEMRRLARQEQEEGAPLYLLEQTSTQSETGLVERHVEAVISNLRGSFTAEAVGTIEALAEATIAAPQVWTLGFRHGRFLADYLRWSLAHARPRVRAFPGAGETIGETMIDVGAGDVLIVYALRRRVAGIHAIIEAARGIGAQIAIVTDSGMVNTGGARWVFRCQTRTRGPIDDHAAAIAFAHVLTEQVIIRLKGSSRQRLGEIDDLHDTMGELE